MRHDAVRAYLQGAFQTIEGWCSPFLWHLITPLAERQAELGVQGPVAEIGVYHGKFFIGLALTKGAAANNCAIDVFDMQQFNLDGAGKGDLERFRGNVLRAGLPEAAVAVMRADSMAITDYEVLQVRQATGGFTFFSVDGCHTPEHTINDIRIAMRLTRPEGIVMVDDYMNVNWPGVQEGVARLFLFDSPRFVPLAVALNKLFLCHVSHHAANLRLLAARLAAPGLGRTKMVTRFGTASINYLPDPKGTDYLGSAAG